MEAGLHVGAVVHVRRHGEVLLDAAIGYTSQYTDRRALSPENQILWLSAGKPLTAIAVVKLAEESLVGIDDPVAHYIPEFAENGKSGVLVRNLLTQTAAYQPPRIDWPRTDWTDIIGSICKASMPPDRVPGKYAAYDPQTTWYLLAEIVHRVTGVANYEYVSANILAPLGCDETASIGMAADKWTKLHDEGNLVQLMDTTKSASARLNLISKRDPGVNADNPTPWPGDDAQRAAAHNPGGGAVGRARDLGAVYQMLLDEGLATGPDGTQTRILSRASVREMTTRQRAGLLDHTFKQTVDWGFGLLINSSKYSDTPPPYGYGRHASESTFGHGGMQSTTAFADPAAGLAVVIIFNGLPGEAKHSRRVDLVNTALYEDLGLS
jgi:CubicO group peptidase (beta-lactamase class C family)